jgi:hypothetical protein
VQSVSIAAYFGYVGWLGVELYFGGAPQSEGFRSIGQWSVIEVIVMALVAAAAGKIAVTYWSERSEPPVMHDDKEVEIFWSCEVGYAS